MDGRGLGVEVGWSGLWIGVFMYERVTYEMCLSECVFVCVLVCMGFTGVCVCGLCVIICLM